MAQHESRLEHQEQDGEKDGETQVFVRQDIVNQMRCAVGVLLMTCLILCLGECTVDETILGIHDSCFGICIVFLINTSCSLVTLHKNLTALVACVLTQKLLNVSIVLQQFQCHIARGITGMNGCIGFQELLDMPNAVLYLMSIVDMDVARRRIGTLIHLNHGAEQLFNTHTVLKRRGNQWCTQQCGEHFEIHLVTALLKFVIHIQGAHYRQVHIQQLRGQIKIALQIRRVNHIDDNIGNIVCQMLAHIKFLRRIARQRISARQVGQIKLITEIAGMSN